MLNKTIKCLLIASTFHVASSLAGVIDNEDFNTSGVNDTVATAQDLGAVSDVNPLTVKGWVDSNNENDVDFYQFTVADPSLTLFFDIDFADDWDQLDHPGDNDRGLDTALSIFNAAGELIAWSDWSDFFMAGAGNQGTDPGSDPFGDHDAFIGGLSSLATGNYFAGVSYFKNIPDGSYPDPTIMNTVTFTPLANSGYAISGAISNTSFTNYDLPCDLTANPEDRVSPDIECTGQYQLQIRTSFDSTSEQIPEPALFSLVGAALLGLYLRLRFLPAQPQRA